MTPVTRGERSERRVILELLKEGINPRAIFHDLYIRKPNGEFTQIDLAVATRVGVIVFRSQGLQRVDFRQRASEILDTDIGIRQRKAPLL